MLFRSLYEAAPTIGGQLNLAAAIPGKEFHETLRYYRHRLAAAAVQVKLNTRVSAETLHAEGYAHVVVATGVYFALFEPLGYAISTSLFLLVMTYYFNKGKTLMNVLTSVLYSFISYYVFTAWLGVNLPRGLLPF